MGFLNRMSTVAAPARARAGGLERDPATGYAFPTEWVSALASSGISVTPELAMTLTAMYCGVSTIAYDIATFPAQVFKYRDDGGKDRIRPGSQAFDTGGIGGLAYLLRYQPNSWQTATDFFLSLVAQFLLRGRAYSEIVAGPTGFLSALLPRHPDRVTEERLPSGRIRYRLRESTGEARYLTQDEMFVVRDMTMDGITATSRVAYGANAIGYALAAERAAGKFFKSGMTAAMVATYTGEKDEDDEAALHASISRYASGVDNSFGLMLIPDDVKIANLAIEPEKAQMMQAREWGAKEVARLLRIPGHKLNIAGTQTFASQVQSALDYVISTLRPIVVAIEQAGQRDLILAKDTYFIEFKMEALLRGDFESQANYLDKMIRNRTIRPSEARLILNMNPDPALDKLSEGDFRPGGTTAAPAPSATRSAGLSDRGHLKAMLAIHDNAVRCVRRERAAVEKLAKKHAADVAGWQAGLREFYAEHAGFISQTMRMPIGLARGYAAQHGAEFETHGVGCLADGASDTWERNEADDLAALALADDTAAA